MKKFTFFFLLLAGLCWSPVSAQERAPSPAGKVEQKVGLTDITVEYSRPSKKGRTIFAADGLVPYGKIWRTGANAATKVTFSDDVKIEGKDLAAGSYALLTLPNEAEWKVHFYPYEASGWSSYREKDPAVAVTVKPKKMGMVLESFGIGIGDLRDNSANLIIVWDDTLVPVGITVK